MPNEQGDLMPTQALQKEIQVYIFGMRQSTSLIDNLRTSRKNKGLQLSKSVTFALISQPFPFNLNSRRKMLVLSS